MINRWQFATAIVYLWLTYWLQTSISQMPLSNRSRKQTFTTRIWMLIPSRISGNNNNYYYSVYFLLVYIDTLGASCDRMFSMTTSPFPIYCFVWCRRWDSWARMTEPLVSKVPMITVSGNHDIEVQCCTNSNSTIVGETFLNDNVVFYSKEHHTFWV